MIVDVEANEREIKEVLSYYNVPTDFEVLYDDVCSKVKLTSQQIRALDNDNVAYWPDGDIIGENDV